MLSKQEWLDCSEELPKTREIRGTILEKSDMVLVWVDDTYMDIACLEVLNDGTKTWREQSGEEVGVTHWMELPASPEKKYDSDFEADIARLNELLCGGMQPVPEGARRIL